MWVRRLDLMDALLGGSLSQAERLQQTLRRFEVRAERGTGPAVNLWLNGDDAVVTAELPGVDARSLDVTVEGQVLTLRGERRTVEAGQGESVQHSERAQGEFVRTVELPFVVDAGKVSAKYERGVLEVTLPRAEAARAKLIPVSLG